MAAAKPIPAVEVVQGEHIPNPLTEGKPKLYILSFNIAKKTNVGNLVRSAVAFGAHELIVVAAKDWFVANNISVCGIEIGGSSVDVTSRPFKGDTAFILGNEGSGMSDAAKAICDQFVYIKHFGQGTASLNVTVAGSIVLHHFAEWAGYTEAPRNLENDEKYNVTEIKYDFSVRSEAAKQKAAERAAKRARAEGQPDVAAAGASSAAGGKSAVASAATSATQDAR